MVIIELFRKIRNYQCVFFLRFLLSGAENAVGKSICARAARETRKRETERERKRERERERERNSDLCCYLEGNPQRKQPPQTELEVLYTVCFVWGVDCWRYTRAWSRNPIITTLTVFTRRQMTNYFSFDPFSECLRSQQSSGVLFSDVALHSSMLGIAHVYVPADKTDCSG